MKLSPTSGPVYRLYFCPCLITCMYLTYVLGYDAVNIFLVCSLRSSLAILCLCACGRESYCSNTMCHVGPQSATDLRFMVNTFISFMRGWVPKIVCVMHHDLQKRESVRDCMHVYNYMYFNYYTWCVFMYIHTLLWFCMSFIPTYIHTYIRMYTLNRE